MWKALRIETGLSTVSGKEDYCFVYSDIQAFLYIFVVSLWSLKIFGFNMLVKNCRSFTLLCYKVWLEAGTWIKKLNHCKFWRSRDLRSAECASLTTRILRNSPLQSVTGVWTWAKQNWCSWIQAGMFLKLFGWVFFSNAIYLRDTS